MSINISRRSIDGNAKIVYYLIAALGSFRVMSMLMKPQHCIAARDLLRITPEILAGYAGVSVETILGFEAQDSDIPSSIVESIQVALEYAGIEFLKTDETHRRLVHLRSHYTPVASCSIPQALETNIQHQKQ